MQIGKYSPANATSACMSCPSPRWTTGKGSQFCDACRAKYYLTSSEQGSVWQGTWGTDVTARERDQCDPDPSNQAGACCKCVDGASCPVGTTIESMIIDPGYYRHSYTTAQLVVCKHEFACAGTKEASTLNGSKVDDAESPLCQVGFTAPLCR